MKTIETDILIVGGGLSGAALVLALKGMGYSCLLLEAQSFSQRLEEGFDARSLALSPASQRILQHLKVWPEMAADVSPIEYIHVSDQHRFGATRLHGSSEAPLGYVAEIQTINRVLLSLLPEEEVMAPARLVELEADKGLAKVEYQSEEYEINARLIVAADGAKSTVRQFTNLTVQTKDFEQTAIVANIELARPHQQKAYERFTPEGPLALLPMTKRRMSLVWAMKPEKIGKMMALSEAEFLKALQQAFGYRLGRFVRSGQRSTFPLKQTIMPVQTQWPLVFVGNAAHTLHPVAGQGFNLGLRDIAMLAQMIARQGINPEMLKEYEKNRLVDQRNIIRLTEGLVRLFSSKNPVFRSFRHLAMMAMEYCPPIRSLLAHHARGFGGVTPDLVCGIALEAEECRDVQTL